MDVEKFRQKEREGRREREREREKERERVRERGRKSLRNKNFFDPVSRNGKLSLTSSSALSPVSFRFQGEREEREEREREKKRGKKEREGKKERGQEEKRVSSSSKPTFCSNYNSKVNEATKLMRDKCCEICPLSKVLPCFFSLFFLLRFISLSLSSFSSSFTR